MDEHLAGACHVFFVRSPVAHARIQAIDVTAALAAPGVVAVFTGADLAGLPPIMPSAHAEREDEPARAGDRRGALRRRPGGDGGHRAAYQGEDAVELVDVDYDPLPAVIDLADAAAGKVLLFEAAGTNVAANFGDAASLDQHLFDDCEVVVPRTIVNQRVAPAPMETRAAAAVWGDDGRLTTWIPNQGAQGTRAAWPRCSGSHRGPGPGHHPGRRRRVRREVRRRPRARGRRPGWPGSWAGRPAGPRPGTRT